MNEQNLRFRLGVFVLGALILLGVLIVLFGGIPGYFKKANSFTIIFETAPGVAPGTPVRRSGVRIGEVRKVSLDDATGRVHVEIGVEPEYSLRKRDMPTLAQGVLGGDATIDFVPRPDGKDQPAGVIEPGTVMDGVAQFDTRTLVQKTAEVMPPAKDTFVEATKVFKTYDKLAPLLEETLKEYKELGKVTRTTVPDLRKTNEELQLAARNWSKVGERFDVLLQTNEDKIVKAIDRLQDTLKRVGDVFSDENQKNLSVTLKNVRISSERFESITKNTEDMLAESKKTLDHVNNSLKRSDEILSNLQKATKPMADRSDAILKNMEESTANLGKVLADLREIMQLTVKGDGTVQRLLSDPGLYNNLNDTACTLNRILPRVDRVLRDVEIFADKIARHPEALGLGGVVRPGSGLKTPPTAVPWRGQ
jgi:phospholipid/cholesterol/gamma-HCH transport system substrate-binding protein